MKFSIIIPVYNLENLILKCLSSLLDQDFSFQEYEIIIVDDGSTDNTFSVIESYSQDKSNILLLHQENNKQGSARNHAWRYAKGKYIWFVDGDDFVERNILSLLYLKAEEFQVEMLCFNNYSISTDNTLQLNNFPSNIMTNVCYKGQELINLKSIYCGPCFIIFQKYFLNKHKLKFKEGVFYEDNYFMLQSYYYAERVYYINDALYYRFMSINSATRKINAQPIFDIVEVLKSMIYFVNNTQVNSKSKSNLLYYIVLLFNIALFKLKDHESSVHEKFLDSIGPIKNDLLYAMYNSWNLKYLLEAIILILSPKNLIKLSIR
jgi:glycosyltransferase involved in cell wall biosynthesis